MEETKISGTNYSMLQDNGILYRSPSQLSTVVARTYKIEYAQRQQYVGTSSPIIFDWNTGTSYVDPQSAILSFTVIIYNNAAIPYELTWGKGVGACNLISEIRIISKNGVEIDRTTEAGQLAKILTDYTLSAAGRSNIGMVDGYIASDANYMTIPPKSGVTPGHSEINVSIPMKILSGFFRPITQLLIPSGLASGCRFEFMLQSADRAFEAINEGALNGQIAYTIENPTMLLQLSDLNDPTSSALFVQSSKSGLSYNFPSFFSSKVSNAGSDRINEQLKKAVSQANRCFAVVMNRDVGADYESITASGFKSMPSAHIKSFNWRLGSQYYPLQALNRSTDYWAVALATFNRLSGLEWQPNQTSYAGFVLGGQCIASTTLDMSDRINLSGSKINNSSVLELRMELLTLDPVDIILFLQFTSEVRTSGNRSVLKI